MDRPRFRSDLVSSPVEENGQRFVDVTDPDSATTFRFYEVEYAVACAMNGERDLGGLADWARDELGLEPSQGELATVITTLGDLGYLAAEDGSPMDVSDLALGAPGKSPMGSGPARRRETPDFGLGQAGSSPRAENRGQRPAAPQVELGVAGSVLGASAPAGPAPNLGGFGAAVADPMAAAGVPAPPPLAGFDDVAGYPPAPSADLSTDLSQHLQIGAADVKEAVRQSKVMAAVPMPDLGEPRREASGARPIELPERPIPTAPPLSAPALETGGATSAARGQRSVPIALIILLLVVIAGAVYYFFFFARGDDAADDKNRPERGAVRTAKPAPPPTPISVLKPGETTMTAVASTLAGKITWLVESGNDLNETDVVAKFSGFERIQKKLGTALEDRKRYEERLDAAEGRGNDAAATAARAKLDAKGDDIDKLKNELDAFLVRAPVAGSVDLTVALGDDVKEGDEILKIKSVKGPQTTFQVRDTTGFEVGATRKVVAKSDPAQSAECTVAKVEDKQVTLDCPAEGALPDGSAVVLQ